jgi:carboxyl-terminal processing protease
VRILFVSLLVFTLSWGSFADTDELNRKVSLNQLINGTLERYHYNDQEIDDSYSKRVFTLFLNRIDPNKHFFTGAQVTELTAFEYKVDNDIRQNTFHFYDLCLLRLKEQIQFTSTIYPTLLASPINLEAVATFETDTEKKDYVKHNTDLTSRWKKTIQLQVAQHYISLYKEAYPSNNALKIEPKLEEKARAKTKKDLDRRFKRLLRQTDSDYFSIYLDCFTNAFGPHTGYLPPAEKEDFDINMSGQLEGIGAVLREEDGYIKVVEIIPGSASWRQGILKAEDLILSVAQPNQEPISIVETPVRDAVKLIRGRKGTTVILSIKKPDGITQTIEIVRDVVVIKSTYAKSGVFTLNNTAYGYIGLPSFYRDFDNSSNRNAASDIKRALKLLNKQNVEGLILDLRNNGGGSLKDAIDISGFFVPEGPMVQVSDTYKNKDVYKDTDKNTYFDKPLIILVNTFSASASEIVSAALQDYDRAIIMGTEHTFGKGTVQKVVDLDNFLFKKKNPLGFIKITIQEYFRINGRSTQFRGVTPDIIYPSRYDYLDVGEKELKYAFRGSATTPATYRLWDTFPNKPAIINQSYARIQSNLPTQAIDTYNTFMTHQKENSNISININELWTNQRNVKEAGEAIEELDIKPNYSVFNPIDPTLESAEDKAETEQITKWIKGFDKDHVLHEALFVLQDIHTSQ